MNVDPDHRFTNIYFTNKEKEIKLEGENIKILRLYALILSLVDPVKKFRKLRE